MTDKTHLKFIIDIKIDCCTRLSQEFLLDQIRNSLYEIPNIETNHISRLNVTNVMLCACDDLDKEQPND